MAFNGPAYFFRVYLPEQLHFIPSHVRLAWQVLLFDPSKWYPVLHLNVLTLWYVLCVPLIAPFAGLCNTGQGIPLKRTEQKNQTWVKLLRDKNFHCKRTQGIAKEEENKKLASKKDRRYRYGKDNSEKERRSGNSTKQKIRLRKLLIDR